MKSNIFQQENITNLSYNSYNLKNIKNKTNEFIKINYNY